MTDHDRLAQRHLPRVMCSRGEYESGPALLNRDVMLLRTRDILRGELEAQVTNPDTYYRAVVCLRSTHAELSSNGSTFFSGRARPGMFYLTEPGTTVRGRFREAPDGVQILVSARYVDELRSESASHALQTDTVGYGVELLRLCGTLRDDIALGWTADHDELYLSGLTLAILGRLLRSSAGEESGGSALAKWRLRRVEQYLEEHLADGISLGDLANASGLSPMHFAGQFRRATGLRPHEFVLRERIERAKPIFPRPSNVSSGCLQSSGAPCTNDHDLEGR